MNVLIASAPATYGYVNLCYRYVELGETAGYLVNKHHVVGILDGLVISKGWKQVFEKALCQVDAVILHHSGENLESTCDAAILVRKLYPKMPIATYGIVANFSSNLFQAYPFDAIVTAGDWEAILADWLELLTKPDRCPRGLTLRLESGWKRFPGEKRLAGHEWGLPALKLLPLDEYRNVYTTHQTVAGIRGSFELSLSVSRGCPYKCWYCQVPRKDGTAERRRPIQQVVQFLREATSLYAFDQIVFFSPCFTLDRQWVINLCDLLVRERISVPWRCVTTEVDLDDSLIERMAAAGCWRIGIGVETLNSKLQAYIGKPVEVERLRMLIQRCRQVGITPMCFLLDGLPGQQPGEVEQDACQIIKWGGEARISKLIRYASSMKRPVSSIQKELTRRVRFITSADVGDKRL